MKTVFENDLRKAVVEEGTYFNKGKFVATYYYDGSLNYEALKGCGGCPCKIFDTLKQAQNNARYYVNR